MACPRPLAPLGKVVLPAGIYCGDGCNPVRDWWLRLTHRVWKAVDLNKPVVTMLAASSLERPAVQKQGGFFNPSPWLESALLGLLVIPGAIMISVLLTSILLAAIAVLLVQLMVRRIGRRANQTDVMAGS